MPIRVGSGNTRIVPPYVQDAIAASKIQTQLVTLNRKGKIGERTLNFKIGGKPVQTDEAIRALMDGKSVRATVMEFKKVGGAKLLGIGPQRGKVRVKGINIATLDSVRELQSFAKKNVFDPNQRAAGGG